MKEPGFDLSEILSQSERCLRAIQESGAWDHLSKTERALRAIQESGALDQVSKASRAASLIARTIQDQERLARSLTGG